MKLILSGIAVAGGLGLLFLGGARFVARTVAPTAGEAVEGAEQVSFRAVGREFRGQIVWSSNRSGSHEIYRLDTGRGEPVLQVLTEDPHVDTFPRFSPDGSKIVFNRSQKPWVSFRDPGPWDVWIMNADGTEERRIAEGGYHPTFSPNGRKVVFDRGGRVTAFLLATGEERVLFDAAGELEAGWVQEPDLRRQRVALTLRGGARRFGVVGLGDGSWTRLPNPGCQISWWPGEDRVLWIQSRGRGGNRVVHAAPDGSGEQVLLDLPFDHSHEYFPRLDRKGGWLALGASASGHEHDRADYEIFLWRVGSPWEAALRLTHHTGNDQWPDVRAEE